MLENETIPYIYLQTYGIVSIMMRGLNIAEQIHQLLLKNPILSLKQLRAELPGRARSSLFRDLKKLDLISSYTHTPANTTHSGGWRSLMRMGFGFSRTLGFLATAH